ncbi:MAG: hypothetical protein Q9167_005634 [Letrouitia subvulpina]
MKCNLKFSGGRTKKVFPDESLYTDGATFPFLVLEAACSQTDKDMEKKVQHWTQGSKGHLRLICILKLRKIRESGNYQVLISIVMPEKVPDPTPEDPEHYHVEARYVLQDSEVYPTPSDDSFEVTLADVLPKKFRPEAGYQRARIPVRALLGPARRAVQARVEDDAKLKDSKRLPEEKELSSSPFDEHQEGSWLPLRCTSPDEEESVDTDVDGSGDDDDDPSFTIESQGSSKSSQDSNSSR